MIYTQTPIAGAYFVDLEPHADDRGFFARTWCRREFEERGLDPNLAQCSTSMNNRRGTLRGMHYQVRPHGEVKLVRCTRGAVHDVILDLRPESSTFGRHVGVDLTVENRRALYIPEGVAHGFVTLLDNTEVLYQISQFHAPEAARGVRWNDPAFAIRWPEPVVVISERDRTYPDYRP